MAQLGLQNARKHSLNQSFFKKIDTERKAYWLGFLYADGSIHNDGVALNLTDKESIETFIDDLDGSHPIYKKKKRKKSHRQQYEVAISSRIMVADLRRHGCHERKSHTIVPPTTVPQRLLNHFIRGLWDGDGGFCGQRSSVCGTLSLLKWVENYLRSQGMPEAKVLPHSTIHRLHYSGRVNLFRLRCILYKKATVFLSRKKEKLFAELPRYEARVPKHLKGAYMKALENKEYPL